jgi:hypothetical protein
MKNCVQKLAILLFAHSFIVSCSFFLDEYCPDDSGNFAGDIKFGKYHRHFTLSDYGYGTIKEIGEGTEEFIFHEDSSFSYLTYSKKFNKNTIDTITKLNGKFKTYRDSGFSWYVLKLSSDSIYIKETDISHSFIPANFISKEFTGFNDSLLSNIDNKSNCFSLAWKTNPSTLEDSDEGSSSSILWRGRCNKIILREAKIFCPEQNSTGDNL